MIRKEYERRHRAVAVKIDKIFACLFAAQWLCGMFFAIFVTPNTWIGPDSQLHIHIYVAVFLGGLLAAAPIFLIIKDPGATINRYAVAVSQMLFSMLFIHITGGRIETHFHVFGSLAFLAAYRDWRPLVLATAITSADHLLRGYIWPISVYGTLTSTPWRAFEHTGWVLFEDIFLLLSMRSGIQELISVARSHVQLQEVISSIETQVIERTKELKASQEKVFQQQSAIIMSAKMASLGQMSAGLAHEINNPLAIILGSIGLLYRHTDNPEKMDEKIEVIKKSSERIAKIVLGLKKFSRSSNRSEFQIQDLAAIVREAVVLTNAKLVRHDVQIKVDCPSGVLVHCNEIEVEQVLINLIVNSVDAIKVSPAPKWIRISLHEEADQSVFRIVDSGRGIPSAVRDKLFEPFFTTKRVGEGTGLGLSITKGILDEHKATIAVLPEAPNTCFEIRFPKAELVRPAA